MIRRSRVVIVICPSLEETVRGIDAGARTRADRERARVRRRTQATPRRRAQPCAASLGVGERRRSCCTPARSRRTRGSTCCSPRWRIVRARGPDARLRAGRRQAGSGRAARARRRAAPGIDDVTIFAGERPAAEIPAYLLAADVLVSPRSRGTNTPLKIYQYLRSGKADRRHAPADAHAGARRRHGDSDRRDAAGIRGRHPGGA